MEAIILAGGRGGRLGKLTDEIPKPMLPIRGRPFLEYLMDYWIDRDVNRFILAVGYKYDVIRNHFKGHYRHTKIIYSIDPLRPIGPEAAITLALRHLDSSGTFIVMNGDTIPLGKSYLDIGTPEMYEFAQRLL